VAELEQDGLNRAVALALAVLGAVVMHLLVLVAGLELQILAVAGVLLVILVHQYSQMEAQVGLVL
jgi:hypothetical protein